MVIEKFTAEKVQNLNWDYSKNTPYEVANAFGFNRTKDKKELAKYFGIPKYTGTAEQNLMIKNMLLDKLKELKQQAEQNIINQTKTNITDLKIEIEKTDLYNKIINSLTIKEGKISLTKKENITIARNNKSLERSSDITDIPLIDENGKWILVKYTDPITNKETILAIDDFANNTFKFRDVTDDMNNQNATTLYAAPKNKAYIDLSEVEIKEKQQIPSYLEPKQITQIPNPVPEINISWTQNASVGENEKKLDTKKEEPGLVLTEDLLQNFSNQNPYPNDPEWRTYAQVYQERYNVLRPYREWKHINVIFPWDTTPTIWNIKFVWGGFEIIISDNVKISIDIYELTPDHIVFYRNEGEEWLESNIKKYILKQDTIDGNTLVVHIEQYKDDKNITPSQNIVNNTNNQSVSSENWWEISSTNDNQQNLLVQSSLKGR